MKISYKLLAIGCVTALALPLVTSAGAFTPYWGPLVSCQGSQQEADEISGNPSAKPCTSFCDLLTTGQYLIKFGMTIVIVILAPLYILWGAILIMVSGANPSLLQRGKQAIFGAAIGVALTLIAYLIVTTFLWLLGNPASGKNRVSWPDIPCNVQPNVLPP